MSVKVKIKLKGEDAEEVLEHGKLPLNGEEGHKPQVGTPAGSAPNGAEEYYGQSNPGGCSESYAVYHEKHEPAASGVHRTQAEGPQGSGGERPAAQSVRHATVDKEVSKKCADAQVGSNRQYRNEHERRHNS